MKRRTLLLWLLPSIFAVLTAMYFARFISRAYSPSLASVRPQAPTYWKPYTNQVFTETDNRRGSPDAKLQDNEEKVGDHLGLPEPSSEGIKLDVSTGEGVRFDALGPMVVNKDGTISRITNWDQMAPIEKENTLRILGKRNKQRLDALKKASASDQANDEK